MIEISTFQDISADFVQEIELDLQIVTLRIVYNIRNDFFHLNFTDPNGVILYGVKIVPNFPLLRGHKAFILFSGDLFVVKEEQVLGDEITYANFGKGYNLNYFTEEEVNTWETDNGV